MSSQESIKTTWRQFHQHYTHEKFVQKSFLAAFSSYALALAKNLYKKFACKTLMKSTPAKVIPDTQCAKDYGPLVQHGKAYRHAVFMAMFMP